MTAPHLREGEPLTDEEIRKELTEGERQYFDYFLALKLPQAGVVTPLKILRALAAERIEARKTTEALKKIAELTHIDPEHGFKVEDDIYALDAEDLQEFGVASMALENEINAIALAALAKE